MAKDSTMPTSRASLCALGAYLQTVQVSLPHCGNSPDPPENGPLSPDRQRARWGAGDPLRRQDHLRRVMARSVSSRRATGLWADRRVPSSPPLRAPCRPVPPETVAQLSRVSWYDLKRSGQTPHHRFAERLLWVDVDVTPRPIGAQAEGSERTWMGRNRSKTGRKVLRWTASAYREILHETLRRGKASAEPALKAALGELETRLDWTRERRQRMVLRLDWGLWHHRGPQWAAQSGLSGCRKISHSGRVRKWRQALGPWQPTSSPGREIAAVCRPHRFCRATRQWVIRTPKEKGGYQYAVLVTTLTDQRADCLGRCLRRPR